MTGVKVPTPPYGQAITAGGAPMAPGWKDWVRQVFNRIGGATDKVDGAFELASAAAPATRKLVAGVGLAGGGELTADVAVRLYTVITTVSALPTTGIQPLANAYATNGRKPGEGAGTGTGCPVIWTNGAWYSLFSGAVVTA